jgi:hypothetical protein
MVAVEKIGDFKMINLGFQNFDCFFGGMRVG